jgi:hypothetical protein
MSSGKRKEQKQIFINSVKFMFERCSLTFGVWCAARVQCNNGVQINACGGASVLWCRLATCNPNLKLVQEMGAERAQSANCHK